MKYSLFILAFLLITGWLVGFVIYSVGAIMHLLLAVACISVLVAIFNANAKKSRRGKRDISVVKS